jgi:hypothetical protein
MTSQANTTRNATASGNPASGSRKKNYTARDPASGSRQKATSKSHEKAAAESHKKTATARNHTSGSRQKDASELRHRGPSQPQQSQEQPSQSHSSEPESEGSEPELPPLPALKVTEQSFSGSTSTSRANSAGGDGRPQGRKSRAARGWITITNPRSSCPNRDSAKAILEGCTTEEACLELGVEIYSWSGSSEREHKTTRKKRKKHGVRYP